jgi:flagellar biosynthesis protein FliR
VDLMKVAGQMLAGLGFRGDLNWFLLLFGLAMARMLAAIMLAPFLGGQAVPGQIKVGLAVVMTAILTPYLVAQPPPQEMNAVLAIALLAKEVMIGTLIGIASQLIFFAIQMSGIIIDTQRGMNQMTFVAPQLPGNSSVLAVFELQASITLFLTLNGHLFFLRAMFESFQQLPVLAFPHIAGGASGIAVEIMQISADTFEVAMQIAAPVLLTLFLIDVSFGAIARIASQVHVHNESQPVKAYAGLAVLLLSIGFTMDIIRQHLIGMLAAVEGIIRSLH